MINRCSWKRSAGLLGLVAGLTGFLPAIPAAPVAVPPVIQRNYDTAKKACEANPEDRKANGEFARACFDRGEFSRDNAERARLAQEGIKVSEALVARDPQVAAGHYYLAMNLAQLARTKLLGALPLLGRMENGWLTALAQDERLDYAGPDRYVGLLYRDAPGWPVSLGDNKKARQHLARAAELCPNFPENYLNLIETYFMWNENKSAAAAFGKLNELLSAAHKEFTGDYWDVSWKDWNERIQKIEAKLKAKGLNK